MLIRQQQQLIFRQNEFPAMQVQPIDSGEFLSNS
jgi:hypothetical protein